MCGVKRIKWWRWYDDDYDDYDRDNDDDNDDDNNDDNDDDVYIWSIEEKAVGGASLMSDSASSQSNAPCGWEPG